MWGKLRQCQGDCALSGSLLTAAPHPPARCTQRLAERSSGRSSGVEHDLAKVGVEGSNPFARSSAFAAQNCEAILTGKRAWPTWPAARIDSAASPRCELRASNLLVPCWATRCRVTPWFENAGSARDNPKFSQSSHPETSSARGKNQFRATGFTCSCRQFERAIERDGSFCRCRTATIGIGRPCALFIKPMDIQSEFRLPQHAPDRCRRCHALRNRALKDVFLLGARDRNQQRPRRQDCCL